MCGRETLSAPRTSTAGGPAPSRLCPGRYSAWLSRRRWSFACGLPLCPSRFPPPAFDFSPSACQGSQLPSGSGYEMREGWGFPPSLSCFPQLGAPWAILSARCAPSTLPTSQPSDTRRLEPVHYHASGVRDTGALGVILDKGMHLSEPQCSYHKTGMVLVATYRDVSGNSGVPLGADSHTLWRKGGEERGGGEGKGGESTDLGWGGERGLHRNGSQSQGLETFQSNPPTTASSPKTLPITVTSSCPYRRPHPCKHSSLSLSPPLCLS